MSIEGDRPGTAAAAVPETVVEDVLTGIRALMAVSTRAMGPLAEEISAAQYRTLVELAAGGPRRLSDLAVALHVNPSTAGRMCERLVRRGLVQRRRAPSDRRCVRVMISPHGEEVLDVATSRRREVVVEALRELSPAQQQLVGAALQKLAGRVDDAPPRCADPVPDVRNEDGGARPCTDQCNDRPAW